MLKELGSSKRKSRGLKEERRSGRGRWAGIKGAAGRAQLMTGVEEASLQRSVLLVPKEVGGGDQALTRFDSPLSLNQYLPSFSALDGLLLLTARGCPVLYYALYVCCQRPVVPPLEISVKHAWACADWRALKGTSCRRSLRRCQDLVGRMTQTISAH